MRDSCEPTKYVANSQEYDLVVVGTTKVYYNSACPVCDAGIKYQRRKLDCSAVEVQWIDVHCANDAVTDINANLEFVRERLHVVDDEGNIHVGSDAFTELCSKSRDQRALAVLLRVPGIRMLWQWLYNAFAKLLYWWNRKNQRW